MRSWIAKDQLHLKDVADIGLLLWSRRVLRKVSLVATTILIWNPISVNGQSLDPPILGGGLYEEVWPATKFQQYFIHPTPGVKLRYTLNGEEPVPGDPEVAHLSSVWIKRSGILKAKAWTNSDTFESDTVTRVFRLTGKASIGNDHTLLLKSTQELFAVGNQFNGRLGNGYTTEVDVSLPVSSKYAWQQPIQNAIDVAAGNGHSVYVTADGKAWAFGINNAGQLGNNTTVQSAFAVQVVKGTSGQAYDLLGNVTQVGAGLNFSGALAEGKVWTWGSQANGRLASGVASGTRKYAAPVKSSDSGNPELTGIQDLDLGENGGLARIRHSTEMLGSLGHVWAWGLNTNGQLGIGSITSQNYASKVKLDSVTFLTDATDVSQGINHSAIVRWNATGTDMQGSVWCMGLQTGGRLGDNVVGTGNTTYPKKVVKADGSALLGIEQVSAGTIHTLALGADGNVWAWGTNSHGSVGDGTTTNRPYAVQVLTAKLPGDVGYPGNKPLSNIVWISAGGTSSYGTSLAMAEDGTVFIWGAKYPVGGSGPVHVATPISGIKIHPNAPDVTLVSNILRPRAPEGKVTLSATVSDADGAADIQKVDFYSRGVLVSSLTSAPWNVTIPDLGQGFYHAYAIVTDLAGNVGMSPSADFVIQYRDPNDTDDDWLEDAWEITHFGSLAAYDGDDDPDADGIVNTEEMALGLDPEVNNTNGGSGAAPVDYSYDDINRLSGTASAVHTKSYQLDPEGNIEGQ